MPARQQQCARRAFAEPGGEQRRTAHLGGDDRFDLVGVEDEQLGARRRVLGVGQPHDDAVVGCGRFLVDAVALAQPSRHRQRQRSVHPKSVGGVQDDPPVAELVAESLHHQRGVRRHGTGGLPLVVDQLPQVVGRIVVETHCRTTLGEVIAAQAGQLTGEGADRSAELGRPADAVAAPERQPRGLTGRRDDQHPVMGDLGDPPAGGAE